MIARLGAWWRRRYRIVLPLGLVVVVLTVTGVVHLLRADDPSSASFLNPTSTAGDGSATLAGRLRAAGVTVERVTSSADALRAADAGGGTVFVPEPAYVLPENLSLLSGLPATTRVVLVAPDATALATLGFPEVSVAPRWATLVADPDCGVTEATGAGPAAVDRVEYGGGRASDICYRGGLATVRDGGRGYLLVGASDPFRNDRIGEAGNAALATALLGAGGHVVWLDLHAPERPAVTATPTPSPTAAPTVTEQPPPDDTPTDGPTPSDTQSSGSGAPHRVDDGPSTTVLLPGWVWAVIGVLMLAALAYTLSRARRFGPPVDEPLPVAAHGRETIEGRGRLYRRARQPAAAFRAPLASALTHARTVLGLGAGAPRDATLAAIAAAAGREPDDVAAVLDADPKTDAELVAALAALDDLMDALQHNPNREEPS